MKQPLVSVIMSVYNEKEEWLKESIESILNQTYKNIEFILIIDDPQQQHLISIIEHYSRNDERIQYYINEKNSGLVYSLNKAINLSKGEFIARMDADDIAYLNRIELQINYLLNHQDVCLVGSQMELVDEIGNRLSKKSNFPNHYRKIAILLKYSNVFCHPSLVFRSDFIKNMNGYREIKYAEDYDLLCRTIIGGYKVANLSQVLIKYRIRMNSVTRKHNYIQMNSDLYIKKYYKNSEFIPQDIYDNKKKLTFYRKMLTKKNLAIYKTLNCFMKDI